MRPAELILASRNAKKLRELREILAPLGIEVRPVSDFADAPEVEETGVTFAENAALKAEAIREATGLATLADDSGLCVDALDGAPGLTSARYAGPKADDAANNRLLLAELDDLPEAKRGAHYECVIAYAPLGEETIFFNGRCDGRILTVPEGEGGFGYDPLFWSDDLNASFAAAAAEAKNKVSHRGRALAEFRQWLAR